MTAPRLLLTVMLTIGLLAVPIAADAQPAEKIWRIGDLAVGSRERVAHLVGTLEAGLHDLGYVEDRTVAFEHRFADGSMERIPNLAAEMVRLKLDVIVAAYPQIEALKKATTTIPIVMVYVTNPVGRGWSRASRGPAATSRDCPATRRPSSGANAWNSSETWSPARHGSPRCGLRPCPAAPRN